jgi:hypothetical protein
MSDSYTADKMAKDYIKLREVIKEKEEDIKKLKGIQEKITDKMLELCADQNLDSVKTPFGTISRRVHSSFWTSDWEQMHQFIKENDAFHLLERRIHNSNMKEFLEDNPDKLPVGLQSDRKFVISVRKPTSK